MFKINNPLDLVFVYILMDVENGIKKGYVNGRWYPHKSPEGGTDTIAFGHKLTKTEQEYGTFHSGLTYEQALELFLQDLEYRRLQTQNIWNYSFENKQNFNELPKKYRYVLLDLVYNVGKNNVYDRGKWKWPKLAKAILSNNDQEVYKQSVRTYLTPNGQRVYLWNRTRDVCRALGINFTES